MASEGKHDVLALSFSRWIPHPHGDDIAIAPLGQIDRDKLLYRSIDPDSFISKIDLQYRKIQPGQETFIVGSFVSHEGQQRNTPSVRFGNISVMPFEGIDCGDGRKQESFLVEARSVGGFSGSPVFVYEPYPKIETVDAVQHRGEFVLEFNEPSQNAAITPKFEEALCRVPQLLSYKGNL